MRADDYFPSDYFAARSAFRARAAAGELSALPIAAAGPNGEILSVDSAYFGSPRPQQLVVITSGIHGVEGYAGSAVQQMWVSEFAEAIPSHTGVLLVHALNPYGFAHNRRVNEHNVDLNRNALARFPGPGNPNYRLLNACINPASPAPVFDDFAWCAIPALLRHGRAALAQAIAAGQYEFPQGLFYGGVEREPSLVLFTELLSAPRFADARRVLHLDLHTGLGRYGEYQLLLDHAPTAPEFIRLAHRFGAHHVKSDHPHHTTHYRAQGILPTLTRLVFPRARVDAATVEFGTLSPIALLRRLRAENRLFHHGASRLNQATRIRRALLTALAPGDPQWRTTVIAGGRQIFSQLRIEMDTCHK